MIYSLYLYPPSRIGEEVDIIKEEWESAVYRVGTIEELSYFLALILSFLTWFTRFNIKDWIISWLTELDFIVLFEFDNYEAFDLLWTNWKWTVLVSLLHCSTCSPNCSITISLPFSLPQPGSPCPTFLINNKVIPGIIPRPFSSSLTLSFFGGMEKRERSWNDARNDFIFIQKRLGRSKKWNFTILKQDLDCFFSKYHCLFFKWICKLLQAR